MEANNILVIHHIPGSAPATRRLAAGLAGKPQARVCLVAFNNTGGELEELGLKYRSATDYATPQDYARWDRESLAIVRSLGSYSLNADGLTLVKFLEYGPTSLWWFAEADFYRYHMIHVIRYIGNMDCIIDREKPGSLVMVDDGSLLVKTIVWVAQARGIPVQLILPGSFRRLKAQLSWHLRQPRRWAKARAGVARALLRRRLWPSGPAAPDRNEARRRIFLASMGREYWATDPATGQKRLEDPVLGFLMRELEKDSANDLIFLLKSPGKYQLRLPREFLRPQVAYQLWECYLTVKVRRAASAQAKVLRKKWGWLQTVEQFTSLFAYHGIDFWAISRDELERLFRARLPAAVKYIELSRELVEADRPNIMVIACENSLDNKALVIAGNDQAIPVLAVQHGDISAAQDQIVDYFSPPELLRGKPAKASTFPHQFALFGESFREVLVKGIGFPFPERLVITGQPGYDTLVRAGEFYSRQAFSRRWQIDPAKKLVLIASQTFNELGNREAYFRSILQALKDDDHLQMVIKPHPAEGLNQTWYNTLLQEIGAKAVVLPPKCDTYEALYACDLLMTFYSTIALEAMILGRPVVTVNLTGQPDPLPYARSGAALGVYRAADIAPAVRNALANPEVRQSLKESQEKYLQRQFHKLDGQATKRMVDLVYSMTDGQV